MNKLIGLTLLTITCFHLNITASPAHQQAALNSYKFFCTGTPEQQRENATKNIVLIDDKRREEIYQQRQANCRKHRDYFERMLQSEAQ